MTVGQASPRQNMAPSRPGVLGGVPGTPAEDRLGQGGQAQAHGGSGSFRPLSSAGPRV